MRVRVGEQRKITRTLSAPVSSSVPTAGNTSSGRIDTPTALFPKSGVPESDIDGGEITNDDAPLSSTSSKPVALHNDNKIVGSHNNRDSEQFLTGNSGIMYDQGENLIFDSHGTTKLP